MQYDTDRAKQLEQEYHIQLFKRYPLTLVKGEGSRVWDNDGNEYIDALAGIAVMSLGHSHPAVVKAIQDQAAKLIHVSNFYFNEPQGRLAELLCKASGMDRAFFCNSGAEAVEAAIKLARKYAASKNRKGNIIAFENCFHGRTLATITMGSEKYQKGFSPLPSGFEVITSNDLDAVRDAVTRKPIAFILEIVQGEGGIRPVEVEYIRELRDICTENDILLILDEVQCGMGRTGKMFAFEHHGIRPDIMTVAKALGNGVPIGSMLTTQRVADAFEPGNHGTTFGGNPLACAAAVAVLETMESEDIVRHAAGKGEYLMSSLKRATSGMDSVREIRGRGLMVGVDLVFKGADVVVKMMEKGVLANCTADTVIRIMPPLTIGKEEIDRVVECLVESINETEKRVDV